MGLNREAAVLSFGGGVYSLAVAISSVFSGVVGAMASKVAPAASISGSTCCIALTAKLHTYKSHSQGVNII